MSAQLEAATAALRQAILGGAFSADERLREVAVADALNVSRTLARLAMSALETEGLLLRQPNRGSRVRAFSADEIADAIEVRGELEGMAARLLAERGLPAKVTETMEDCLQKAEVLMAGDMTDLPTRRAWTQMNQRFHDAVIGGCGNRAIGVAIRQVSLLPLASASSIIFDLKDIAHGHGQLLRSHEDHRLLLEAIAARQGGRAEAIFREHAFRSAENRRHNLALAENARALTGLPGAHLIRPGT